MWTKFKNWFMNQFKSPEEWYLENARDAYDLEIRMMRLQRQALWQLHTRYWND